MTATDRPSVWPEVLEVELWAKSADRGQGGEPESLAFHTWQVLRRLADFIRLRPGLAQRLEAPSLWRSLYWACFLHDFGKAMPAFQRLLRGDRTAKDEWGRHRHELFSLAFVDWLSPGLSEEELAWVAAAIISHHRDRDEIFYLYSTPEPDEPDPLAGPLSGLPAGHVKGLYEWLSSCGWVWAEYLGLDEFGITPISFLPTQPPFRPEIVSERIRHWLTKYDRLAGRPGTTDLGGFASLISLRGMILSADHSGSAGAPDLPRLFLSPERILTSRNLAVAKLYEHQRQAGETSDSTILVAPTGSGKTEAALLWAAQQAAEGNAPRLFYTLPYQASMNAMVRRLADTFGREYIGLQHGRALLATYRWLMEEGEKPEKASQSARQRQNLAKLHYPPVRVFSPYQMLKAMYRLKGYEAQLTDYHDGLFIFDEIHAYEVNRLALILCTIAYLRRYYNARFFIMSATFPKLVQEWLEETLGETSRIIAEPDLYAQFQRHRIRLVEGEALDEHNLLRIKRAALSGQSVLVVCNIVARAQQVYDWLDSQLTPAGIETVLLHGRFNMRDRLTKEQIIRERTGADRANDCLPIVLVATQAVEVSLDIDLDTIYTEPAPLEALVQRFGRVNRRGKKGIVDVHVFTVPPEAQKNIYNPQLVERTLNLLARENGRPIDESLIGRWLDEIYAGEIAEEWRRTYAETAAEFNKAVVNVLRPFQSDRNLERTFDKLFDGIEVLPEDLLPSYEAMIDEGEYITASELLVPISYRQLAIISQARLQTSEKGERLITIEVPYSAEIGLDLSVLQNKPAEGNS